LSPPAASPAPPPAWLAPPVPPSAPVGRQEAPKSSWRSILLLLVVGGIGGYAFYLRRRRHGALAVPTSTRLQVLETVRVSPRAQVVLTQVNGRLLLLGVSDRSVRRIAWMGRAPEAAKVPASRSNVHDDVDDAPTMRPKPGPHRPFGAMIDALKGIRTTAPPPPSNAALQIAEETTDTYERRSPANTNRLSSVPPYRPPPSASSTPPGESAALRSLEALVAASPTISQLEGQVSGLRRRATKRKS
jgi:flagellar biogenesis protein FliO